jgi:WD repeat-containing protein 61
MSRPRIAVQKQVEYTGHKGSVFCLALDQAERYLYSSGDDGVVARWDLHADQSDGEGVVQLGHGIYSLLLVERHHLLVAGGSNGAVYFIDLAGPRILHTFRKREDSIYHLWHDPDRDTIWILQGKGAISVLQLPGFEEKGYLKPSSQNLRSLYPGPGKGQAMIGASDGMIRVLNLKTGKVEKEWQAHERSVFALAVHRENKYLLSGGMDAHLNVWDLKKPFQSIQKIPAHNFTVNDIVISPDYQYVATASRDKTLKLWDADDLKLLKVVNFARNEGHKHSVNKLKWLKSDNSVISSSDDRRIIRWQFIVEK